MTTEGLRLEGVSLRYGDGDEEVAALDNVSVAVETGELVAVTGASGSGKSSLLAVAGAMRTPDSGKVFIAGTDITTFDRKARTAVRRDQIGFVFQGSNLLASLSAVEQLELVGRASGSPRRRTRERALELLAEVGLEQKSHRRPAQLSGGERQRVGIARALMSSPAVLLVDEPTSALDHQRAVEIVSLLHDETTRHRIATLLVTHDLSIAGIADRVIDMQDGRVSPAGVAAS